MSGREVPYDDAAEAALLGAMLLSTTAIERGEALLQASDFYRPAHQHVFDAIVSLWHEGHPADAVTVCDVLRQRSLLDAIGGPATLVTLQTNCPSTSNAKRYAQIVLDHAQLRRVLALTSEIAERAYDRQGDPGELIDELVNAAHSIEAEIPQEMPDDLSTLDAFLTRPEETRAPWIVPGLIRRGWRVMVVAGEGAGKTTLFRQIAIGAAGGIHPMWHEPIEPVKCLVVDLENPEESIDLVCAPIMETVQHRVGEQWREDRLWLWHRPGGIDLRTRRDRISLENVIQKVRPDLVCIGPLYKSYRSTAKEGGDEIAAGEVQNIFDDLRTRYGFGLLIEHHPPHGEKRSREMRPHGSSLWLRWPEIGIGLEPVKDRHGSYELSRWRGDRLPNMWPLRIDRSAGAWPWSGIWPDGTFDRGQLRMWAGEDGWDEDDDDAERF